MKVLLDTCVWGKAAAHLRSLGHDVVWAGDWPSDPGDEEILDTAYREGRILITLDKDFGELAVASERPHAGIVRLAGFRALDQGPVAAAILERFATDLESGALVTVEVGRVRVRAMT